ncbi:hypothetical protein LY624_11120 [Pseudoalteromonas sp. N1230-9]|uniref:hypothetical protein n=1 Tax=Pseudoalteromonas TaxID=53246 RepID=UPI0009EE5198|nr:MULTISPECIES: hypothetical protein [Pseudoalteromonas]MCF7516802.1 hypothetical protein [Pseudoalteromonas sp. L21]QWV06407.1 hypothetical protein KQ246_08610 [Pseudoalteromonas shioyasakiensis]WOC25144.1 hypothetical protein LY624_11120 [Pseudoalteromonas sp. N1230-9]
MKHYYINDNAQNTGEHEVHTESCPYFNLITDRTYLGFFHSCKDAVEKAKTKYSNVDGCKHCCSLCHTR